MVTVPVSSLTVVLVVHSVPGWTESRVLEHAASASVEDSILSIESSRARCSRSSCLIDAIVSPNLDPSELGGVPGTSVVLVEAGVEVLAASASALKVALARAKTDCFPSRS